MYTPSQVMHCHHWIREAPILIVVPIVMFVCLAGIGSWAVLWSANLQNALMMSQARAVANSTAMALELTIFVNVQPALVLSLFIRQNPMWSYISKDFAQVTANIIEEASGVGLARKSTDLLPITMRLAPFGVAALRYLSECSLAVHRYYVGS